MNLFDADGQPLAIDDIVNVPMKITAQGVTQNGIPLVTLVAKYNSPNNTTLTVSTAYCTQTVKDR